MQKYADTGDHRFLQALYHQFGDALYHFLLTLTDSALAEDISQKTWLRLIEKRHLYQQNGRFSAWLFTMGRNLLMDHFRQNHRLTPLEDWVEPSFTPKLQDQRLEIGFSDALAALPFEQREAFCLQQEGFGMQEIADITHANTQTVKSRIRYAKQGLKRLLEGYHD